MDCSVTDLRQGAGSRLVTTHKAVRAEPCTPGGVVGVARRRLHERRHLRMEILGKTSSLCFETNALLDVTWDGLLRCSARLCPAMARYLPLGKHPHG
jgi:hypothetical protein